MLAFVVFGHILASVSPPQAGAVWIRCSSVAHRARVGCHVREPGAPTPGPPYVCET